MVKRRKEAITTANIICPIGQAGGIVLRLKSREQTAGLSKSLPFNIPTKSELEELLPYLTSQDRQELDRLLAPIPGKIDWLPQPGPQTLAYYSKADLVSFGGSAAGGKTDLLFGVASKKHHRSIIFRREFSQLAEIIDRSQELFMGLGRYTGSPHPVWYFEKLRHGKKLEFGAADKVGTERKYQGRAHDCKAFDEVTHFTRRQFDYLRGWNRPSSTTPQGQQCQTYCTFNPPMRAEERWILDPFAPWIDRRKYPERETPGKLLYFISVGNDSIQVDGPGKHTYKGRAYLALSRTFIPSSMRDNMYIDMDHYEAVLSSLPEPLRSQLRDGDFEAGIGDDPWQLIPTDWIMAAQARWRERKEPDGPVNQIGVDVSRGGKDQTVASPRKGNYFCKQMVWAGKLITDGDRACQAILPLADKQTFIVVDAVGVGTSAFDSLKKNHTEDRVLAFIGSAESIATDKSGYLGFFNARAEAGWALRELLDPKNNNDAAIPDDPELTADLQAQRWELTPRGIKLIAKEDIMEELGRSPDKGESLMYSYHMPFRRGQGFYQFFEQKHEEFKAQGTPEEKRQKDMEQRMSNIRINDFSGVKLPPTE